MKSVDFSFACIGSFLLLVHTVLFFLSYRRIRKVRKASQSVKNSPLLKFAQQIAGSFVWCIVLSSLFQFFDLYTKGTFGTIAIINDFLMSLDYMVLYALFFLILSQLNMDFTLETKVTADGHLLIVGVNERGREIFKLYMNEVESNGHEAVSHTKVNEWLPVVNRSYLSDCSSDE